MLKNSSTLSPRIPLTNALRVCSVLLLALACFSCSTYENVTGYFNTFYNASKIFDDAVAEVEHAPQKDRDTNYFAASVVSPGTSQKFDKVIEKCSKLIQFHPNSSWVQDGILMIAKSYVYKGDYEPAFRKFTELIENFPTSGSRFEAKLWYARSKYSAKDPDAALLLAKELFPEARAEGKDEIMLQALMLEAQISFDRGEYGQAAATYLLAVEVSGDGYERAWSQYELGVCYEKTGETAKAAEAYDRVTKYSPDLAMEFRAKLQHGKMLSEEGKHKEAIAKFEDLIADQLAPEEFALADLEIANTYWAMGDSAQAFALYDFIDTTYRRTDAAAKSYYRQGAIYEHHFANFNQAYDLYTKARAENPVSEITPKAVTKADNFTTYFNIRRSLRNYDSLLVRALTPDSVLARLDSIAFASDTTRAKLALAADSILAQAEAGNPSDSIRSAPAENMRFPSPERLAARRPRPSAASNDMRSRRAHLDDIADEPDDRAMTKAEPAASDSTRKGKPATNPYVFVKLSPDSLRTLVTHTRFELASLFFLQMSYPDSALYWFDRVVQDDSASELVPKALYAMAEIERTKGDSLQVDSLYRLILLKHAHTEYSLQVQKVLGMQTEAAPVDPAETHYAAAESLLQVGNTGDAVSMFKEISQHPTSLLVPKATYSVGWIYENILKDADSAAVWYRQLLKAYPKSVYAIEAQPRLAVKDDPKSIERYLKVKKIDAVAKPVGKNPSRRLPAADRPGQPPEEQVKDPADEPDEEETPPPEDKDDSDDSDDGGGLSSVPHLMPLRVQ